MSSDETKRPGRRKTVLAPAELYPAVEAWLQGLRAFRHTAGLVSVAEVVTAVLIGQSLRVGGLARTLLSAPTVAARHRYRRVRRMVTGARLRSTDLTPALVRAALVLVDDAVPHLAMDTVRCGPWEVITIGVVWHGRVLLVGWEVVPYPWPRGAFTPAVLRLLWRVAASWPAERRPHLVADRGFPSLKLFRTVEQLGWGWTIRLRVKLNVGIDGEARALTDLLAAHQPGRWTDRAITYGTGRQRVAGRLVIGRADALRVLPRHQANPGSLRQRARQQATRVRELRGKHPGRRASSAVETDGWMLLFTSHTDWLAANRSYTRRWATEGSYRDAQSGYDGQHGWNLEPTLARETDAHAVDRLVGLWALSSAIQTALGDRLTHMDASPAVAQARARWTTTDRLSVWMRGRFALTDPFGDLAPSILDALHHTAQRLRDAPPLPLHAPSSLRLVA